MTGPINALVVEDSEPDALLVVLALKRDGWSVVFERVDTAEAMEAALDQRDWDVIICDYLMPGFTAIDALRLMHRRGLDLPFIIVSGKIGEETAVDAMRAGAHDYLLKGNLTRLPAVIERELREAELRLENKRAEETVARAVEREQRRIGEDLHDGLVQHLSGIYFLAQALKSRLHEIAPDEEGTAVRISELINEAVNQARGLARGLCPVGLETEGLTAALKHLVQVQDALFPVSIRFSAKGEMASAGGSDFLMPPSLEMATGLYRIAQEAISNAVRHASAHHIFVDLQCDDDKMILSVRDDGVGIPPGAKTSGGMGLSTMAYRARSIGASISIGPTPDGGTEVKCELNLEFA